MPSQPRPALRRQWTDNLSWEFFVGNYTPEPELCTAVYCLAIIEPAGRIVLTRVPRGWEMLGGHIDPGETVHEALIREALEEGGFHPKRFAQYGYGKVTAKEPEPNTHHGGIYPQTAYVLYFLATTTGPLLEPTGEEVLERRAFTFSEIAALGTDHLDLIQIGLEQYCRGNLTWQTI